MSSSLLMKHTECLYGLETARGSAHVFVQVCLLKEEAGDSV